MEIKTDPTPTVGTLKWAAAIFIPMAILITFIIFYNHQTQIDNKLKVLLEQEKKNISSQQHLVANIFESAISDLELLSLHSALIQLLSPQQPQDYERYKQELSQEFLSFIEHKKVFDQLRLINKDGMEVVRVEKFGATPHLIPQDRLQNKSDRFYFTASITSPPETIHIAPINLNMEHGKIQTPHKPVSQLSMALAGSDGETHGVLVLNYLAKNIFIAIDSMDLSSDNNMQLINADGFWIKGVKEENAWGDIIETRKDRAFSIDFPDAWQHIAQTKSGQFINTQGMFTFTKIQPFGTMEQNGHAQTTSLSSSEESWILLSFIPADKLKALTEYQGKFTLFNGLILLLIWLIFSLLFARNRLQHKVDEDLIKENDGRIQDIVETAFDCIITIDEKGIISSFNPAACKMFGYEEQEMMGQSINMIVPSPHKEQHDDYLSRYIKTREAHIIKKPREVDGLRKDGSTFPIELCVGAKETGNHWLFTGIIRDITERKELTAKLEKMATTDALTNIYNRGFFNTKLEEEFRRAQRYKSDLSIIMMDLDHFKSVNDYYGHAAGDAVLIALAKQIKQSVRDIDIVARYGGEEFVIIMPETDINSARTIAERIRQDIENMQVDFEGQAISRTASIGIVCFKKSKAKTADDLLIMADSALYKAKESGRNKVVVHVKI